MTEAVPHVIDLSGRVAVVTGATSGLGHRFVRVLAGAGATVIASGRRAKLLDELAATHPNIHTLVGDVTSDADRQALIAKAGELGGLDILVNNAGWAGSDPAVTQSMDDVEKTFAVDVYAVWGLSVLAARAMKERGGSIINIASMLGLVASAPVPQASYGAAKGAVISMTRHFAAEWARQGVRVNAIAPGWFPSALTEQMLSDEKAAAWIRRNAPMGRPGRDGELDGTLLLLAGPGSSYITGQTITVDGGWTAR